MNKRTFLKDCKARKLHSNGVRMCESLKIPCADVKMKDCPLRIEYEMEDDNNDMSKRKKNYNY